MASVQGHKTCECLLRKGKTRVINDCAKEWLCTEEDIKSGHCIWSVCKITSSSLKNPMWNYIGYINLVSLAPFPPTYSKYRHSLQTTFILAITSLLNHLPILLQKKAFCHPPLAAFEQLRYFSCPKNMWHVTRVYSAKAKRKWKLVAIFVEAQPKCYKRVHSGLIPRLFTCTNPYFLNMIYSNYWRSNSSCGSISTVWCSNSVNVHTTRTTPFDVCSHKMYGMKKCVNLTTHQQKFSNIEKGRSKGRCQDNTTNK